MREREQERERMGRERVKERDWKRGNVTQVREIEENKERHGTERDKRSEGDREKGQRNQRERGAGRSHREMEAVPGTEVSLLFLS